MKLEDVLLIDTNDLAGQGVTVACCWDAVRFPILNKLVKDGRIGFCAPVGVELLLQSDGNIVRADGRLKTTVRLVCSRCLEEYNLEIDLPLGLVFEPADGIVDIREEELELTAEQIELIPYKGGRIDLRPQVAEQIVLALPMKPLCGSGCKGLCPCCGENLNHGTCKCPPAEPRGPFAGLKVLLKTKDSSQEEK